jgi:hypothetical protein
LAVYAAPSHGCRVPPESETECDGGEIKELLLGQGEMEFAFLATPVSPCLSLSPQTFILISFFIKLLISLKQPFAKLMLFA